MIEVYYIEDDETIADLVKEYLAQQNCSVLIFRTISEQNGHCWIIFLH